jgi:hypothetical protein
MTTDQRAQPSLLSRIVLLRGSREREHPHCQCSVIFLPTLSLVASQEIYPQDVPRQSTSVRNHVLRQFRRPRFCPRWW